MPENQNTSTSNLDKETVRKILDESELPHRNALRDFFKPSFEYLALLIEAAEEKQSETDTCKTITEISTNVCRYYIETFYQKPFSHIGNIVNYWRVYVIYREMPEISSEYYIDSEQKSYILYGASKNIAKIEDLMQAIADHEAEIGYIGSLQQSADILEDINICYKDTHNSINGYTPEEINLAVQINNSNILTKILEALTETKPQPENTIENLYGTSVACLSDTSIRVKRYHDKQMVFLNLSDVADYEKRSIMLAEINGDSEETAIDKACEILKKSLDSYEGPKIVSAEIPLHQVGGSPKYWKLVIEYEVTETPVFVYEYTVKGKRTGDSVTITTKNSKGQYMDTWTVGIVTTDIHETALKEAKAIIAAHWNLYAPFLIRYSNLTKLQEHQNGTPKPENIHSHLLRLADA